MGLMDNMKDLAKKADDAADLAREHADKLPGDMGDKVTDTSSRLPSLARRTESKVGCTAPCVKRNSMSASSPSRSGGMTNCADCPMASSAL